MQITNKTFLRHTNRRLIGSSGPLRGLMRAIPRPRPAGEASLPGDQRRRKKKQSFSRSRNYGSSDYQASTAGALGRPIAQPERAISERSYAQLPAKSQISLLFHRNQLFFNQNLLALRVLLAIHKGSIYFQARPDYQLICRTFCERDEINR